MKTFEFDASRFLGYVSKVSPSGIRIHIPSAQLLSRFRHNGTQYPGGTVGEFALVEGERLGFLVRILSLELPEGERLALSEKAIHEDGTAFHPMAFAEVLFAFPGTQPEQLERTISQFPEIGAKVYSCPSSFLNVVIGKLGADNNGAPIALLGHLSANGLPCSVPLDSIFGRHCAVVGTTGGGKSWTVARLLLSLMAQTENKIILLDPTGEYGTLNQSPKVKSVVVGHDCHFPYEKLRIADLFCLLRPTAQAQRPILSEAIKSLKTVRLALNNPANPLSPTYIEDGCLKKTGRPKGPVLSFQNQNTAKLDDGFCSFDITKLLRQVDEECVYPSDSGNRYGYWGGKDQRTTDYQSSLKFRIQEIISSKEFNEMFQFDKTLHPQSTSMVDLFEAFWINQKYALLRLDFSQTTAMFNAREILANSIARHLYETAKRGQFKISPILVFVDEAHLFLNKYLMDADQSILPLDAFDLIAKECRKYGLFLCLATQMPRDIPVGTLSQMGTFIAHRLINDQDRKVVEMACSSISHASLEYLPVLGPGEALVTGVDFPMPLLMKIGEPPIPPDSSTPRLIGRHTL